MNIKVQQQEFNETTEEWEKKTKILNLPDELPANVGDKADRKLKAEVNMDKKPNSSREGGNNISASTTISSTQFAEVTDYLATTMIDNYNRGDEVDMSKLTDASKKKIAKKYFNQLDPFGSKKKEEN